MYPSIFCKLLLMRLPHSILRFFLFQGESKRYLRPIWPGIAWRRCRSWHCERWSPHCRTPAASRTWPSWEWKFFQFLGARKGTATHSFSGLHCRSRTDLWLSFHYLFGRSWLGSRSSLASGCSWTRRLLSTALPWCIPSSLLNQALSSLQYGLWAVPRVYFQLTTQSLAKRGSLPSP